MNQPQRIVSCPLYARLALVARWLHWTLRQNLHGRLTKVPDCSTRHRDEWRVLAEVLKQPSNATSGPGLVLTGGVVIDDHLLIGIDLDGCRDPKTGAISTWADGVLNGLGRTFTEVTPSGTGLRAWVYATERPKLRRRKVRVDQPRPPGVDKQPELQLFGLGEPCYVTVTADHLPGTSLAPMVADLGPLCAEFDLLGEERDGEPTTKLPTGDGEPPTLDQVEAAVRAAVGNPMVDADWKATKGAGDKSASDVFMRLERAALDAARWHGATALRFLLERTAWGKGEVDDSKDPLRYGKPRWVAADLARVAAKFPRPDVAAAFKPLNGAPAAAGAAHDLLEPFSSFVNGGKGFQFLVHGLIPAAGYGQFFGDPSAGKTPFALSLAVHVAFPHLSRWFGHDVDLHGPVVYMVGEGREGMRKRLRAELMRHGVPIPATPGPDEPLQFTTRPGMLTDAADVTRWAEAVRAVFPRGCALLVVDTLAQNFGAGNEDSTEDMVRFIQHCGGLQRVLGCCVLTLHHPGHGDKMRARGSSASPGAEDFIFRVEKVGKLGTVAWPMKEKDWERPEPLRGNLDVVEIGRDEKGRPVTTVALRDTAFEAVDPGEDLDMDEDLKAMITGAKALHDGGASFFSQRQLAEAMGLKRGERFYSLFVRVEELGLIKKKLRRLPPLTTTKPANQSQPKIAYFLTEKGFYVVEPVEEKWDSVAWDKLMG